MDWLKNQGRFQEVREMPHSAWMAISPVLRVACYQVGNIDSALVINSPLYTILNLKHCDTHIPALKRFRHQLGHMNLLLDQFSIAGNRKNVDRRRFMARDVLDNFVRDIKHIEPDFVFPFAISVRFSHKENAYMNTMVNTLDDVAAPVDRDKHPVMPAMNKYRCDRMMVGEQFVPRLH